MSSTDVTFDLTQTSPKASAAGYTRTSREALKNDGLVKFRESFIKKLVTTHLSQNLQVQSYKPTEMSDKSNFFYAIASWSEASLYFESWFRTHFANNVFFLQARHTPAATASAPNPTETVKEIGNLFTIWHNTTPEQVFESCVLYMNYSTSEIEAQNLNITWEFLLKNVDSDLRAAIIAEVSCFVRINPDAAQSGPMAFWVIANRIIRSTEALAHNVITGLMMMGLIHFKGENVVTAVSLLRNVLLFLAYGTPRSKAPSTIMDIIFDIFLRCSNPTFVTYVRHLKDFEGSTVNTPETLFTKVQAYYNDLLLKPNGWLRTTKNRAAFLSQLPELAAFQTQEYERMLSDKPTKPAATIGKETEGKGIERDRKGNIIDRTPPKDGVTERTGTNGNKEYWCGKCNKGGRWGNHKSAGHDDWFAKLKERQEAYKARKRQEGNGDSENNSNNTTTTNSPPSMHRGNATLCQPTQLPNDITYESDSETSQF